MLPGQRGTEIKRLKNEVEKLKADLRGKDNEINDLKALVDYLIWGDYICKKGFMLQNIVN